MFEYIRFNFAFAFVVFSVMFSGHHPVCQMSLSSRLGKVNMLELLVLGMKLENSTRPPRHRQDKLR